MKSRFSIIFTIIIVFSMTSCEKRGLPDFTEVLERWGISMRHPKFEKMKRLRSIENPYPSPTFLAGSLKGCAKDHTLQIIWHLGAIRSDASEDEYNKIKQFLSSSVDNQGKRWIYPQTMPEDNSTSPKDSNIVIKKWEIKQVTGDFKWEKRKDFMKDSCDYFTSPMGHKVLYQTWSYKDTADEAVYGASSIWCCEETNRMFRLTISNKYNNSEALLKKYLEHFKCHGIKP
jgi:hypothetical protein